MNIGLDIFYQLRWGVRLESSANLIDYLPPQETSGGSPLDISVGRYGRRLALGFVYHLL